MPAMLANQIRLLLARHWIFDSARMNDRQVAQAFERLIGSSSLRELEDIEVGLEYCSDFSGDSARRRVLIDAAVERLKFSTPPDRGILYSGQYAFDADDNRRMGTSTPAERLRPRDIPLGRKIAQYADEVVKMEDVAKRWAVANGKWTIGHTAGARWLNARPLKRMIGREGESAIWSMASVKYVNSLAGQVEIFLAYPDFARVFRSTEGHLLYKNAAVTDITYYLEHGSSRISSADFAELRAGKVRHAHGKKLTFKVSSDPMTVN